jgi:microcystin-dependent protein
MAFQTITVEEITVGKPIDGSLLSKVKNNDDALKAVNDNQETTISELAIVPIGAMLPFAGTVAPSRFIFPNGQLLSRAAYPGLFAVIGTTWGAGDGVTTFNAPDTRSAFLRGAGSSTVFTQNHTTTLGVKEDDALQGHIHPEYGPSVTGNAAGSNYPLAAGINNYGTAAGTTYSVNPGWIMSGYNSSGSNGYQVMTGAASYDGANGTPRKTNETRPNNIGVNYIMRAL